MSDDEQALAALVYERTAATGAELADALSPRLSAPEVQSVLDRLVAKDVLRETRGRDQVRLYVQALRRTEIQQQAARQLAEAHFDGSLADAARLLLLLVHKHEPEALLRLASFVAAVPSPKR